MYIYTSQGFTEKKTQFDSKFDIWMFFDDIKLDI